MLLIPLRTDRRLHHVPWVNFTLIGLNVIVFFFTRSQVDSPEAMLEVAPILDYYLNPLEPRLYQFITYAFLHADGMHILFNMVFLYVFGNAVEDRLGKAGYLLFYLAGAVVSGLGHAATSDARVLGASGAVSAVTGAYLVLFPRSQVLFFWFFIAAGTFEISALVIVGFKIAMDIISLFLGGGGVAYAAHLSGYGLGIVAMLGLLVGRILPRESSDLLAVLEHRQRRRAFKRHVEREGAPWDYQKPTEVPSQARPPTLKQEDQAVMELRAKVQAAMAAGNAEEAGDLYEQLIERSPSQVFSQRSQLDLAMQLISAERRGPAATAMEQYLRAYPTAPGVEQVQLMLAVTYARYLDQPQRAAELARQAIPKLNDPQQADLARSLLKPPAAS